MEKLINTLDIEPGETFKINNSEFMYELEDAGRWNEEKYVIYNMKGREIKSPAVHVYKKAFYVQRKQQAMSAGLVFLIQELQKLLTKF